MANTWNSTFATYIDRETGLPVECFNCWGLGHFAYECTSSVECFNCGGLDHFARDCTSPVECYECGGVGHLARDCACLNLRKKQRVETRPTTKWKAWDLGEEKTWSSRPAHHTPSASAEWGPGVLKGECLCPCKGLIGMGPANQGHTKDGSFLEIAQSLSSSTNVAPNDQDMVSLFSVDTRHKVLVDSGASHPITPLLNALEHFTPQNIMLTMAAKGQSSMAQGTGTLNIRFHGNNGAVTDYKMPETIGDMTQRKTLLATKALQAIGITTSFPAHTNLCILLDEFGSEICRGCGIGNDLYEMPITVLQPKAQEYSVKVLSVQMGSIMHHALAHLRLGHVNERDLASIVRAGKLQDIKVDDLREDLFCYGCKLGKAAQLPYTHPPRQKVTKPGGRVHIDIWGPVRVQGLRGEKYMLVMVDEATQHMHVDLLREKGDAAEKIREYKVRMEKQYGNFLLKILRSDNAREILLSNSMQKWMRAEGIVGEESPPYTPQHNGKSERAMRTIMDPTRSILAMAELPYSCWSEIVISVVYIKNRLPTQAIGGRVPLEVLTHKKVDLSHLRVLGCDAYALHKGPGRHKLEPKGDRYVLIGFGTDSGTYRLLHPNRRTIVISRDVVFNEEGFIRRRYLPFYDHAGMEGATGGNDDLISPTYKSKQPPSSGIHPLNIDPSTLNEDNDDSSDDDDYLAGPPEPVAVPGIAAEPHPVAPPRTPSPSHQPPQQPSYHPKLAKPKNRRQIERPPTPPSPSPPGNTATNNRQEVRSESPDPLTLLEKPELEARNNEIHSWRGSEQSVDDELPPWLDNDDSLDPLTDPKFDFDANMVIMETKDRIDIPKSFKEAMRSPYSDKWLAACEEEMDALIKKQTWDLIANPGDHPVLTGKWVFDVKVHSPTQVRFKARWVARGFNQQYGIDYKETFAAVMVSKSWHILLAIAAETGYKIRQYDVSNAFLNGNLEEKVYLEQPHGFAKDPSKICALKKSLYGLKQAANVWNQELERILTTEMKFVQTKADSVVFVRNTDNTKVILGGHVDDLLVLAQTEAILDSFGEELARHLKIKSGDLQLFLGVEIIQNSRTGTISIHHRRKITNLLSDLGMFDAKPVSTPLQPNVNLSRADCPTTGAEQPGIDRTQYRSTVGALMHIMVMSRPDICPAVKLLSEVLDNPSKKHMDALHWLLRYLAGTVGFGITYLGHKDPRRNKSGPVLSLHGYYDADWARDEFDRRSRSGYVFQLAGGAISWWSGKQELVATSTTHAEYVGQDHATRELLWILQFLNEIGFPPAEVTRLHGHTGPTLFGDNQSAQALARNPVHHKLSKHFDVKYHFIREQLRKKVLNLVYCPSSKNVADIMTKPLSKQVFERHREAMGMDEVVPKD